MNKKKIITIALVGLVLVCGVVFVFSKKIATSPTAGKKVAVPDAVQVNEAPQKPAAVQSAVSKSEPVKEVKKANLYSDNNSIPLCAIVEISNLSENIKNAISEISESANLLHLKHDENGIYLIANTSGEEQLQRHGIEFIKINSDGESEVFHLGYHTDIDADKNDEWKFDNTTGLPLEHIKHESRRKILFTEIWNYSPESEIKYQMIDEGGNVIAIKKETPDGDENIRIDNLIYNPDGSTKISITANYSGPDITRFTYYNSEYPDDGVTLISEYADGLKTVETVYSSDYKLKQKFKAHYQDGERVSIKVLDSDDNEKGEILAE